MSRFLAILALALGIAAVVGGGAFAWTQAQASAAPIAISVTSDVPVFTPRVALASIGRTIVFRNSTDREMQVQSAPHDPASFNLTVPAGGSAHLTLTTPGLYHFYDAATAHIVDYQADNDVIDALPGAPNMNLPNQGWVIVPGPGGVPNDNAIHVPSLHDLFQHMAVVVHVGGSVVIHNFDTDAHNIVTDPADPTGAAFELLGTNGEPTIHGAERRITFTRPGLYHIYCSIHSKTMGTVGGWQVVMPRDSNASGYSDRDPMEAWILVLP